MTAEAPVLAGMTETPAGDIETADFCRNCGDEEDQDKRRQERQSPDVKTARDERYSAEDFQPGQIKSQSHAHRPRQNFVVVDVAAEPNRLERFDHTGVNENPADDQVHNSPDKFHFRAFSHSSQPPWRTKTSFNCASLRKRR